MWNRFTRGTAAIASALLVLGAAGGTMTGTANAASVGFAGYQAGNGAWNFRYVTTTFPVPLQACSGHDDFVAAGAELVGSLADATVAVVCENGTPTVAWGTSSLASSASGNLIVSGDDNVTLSAYYDATTGFDYFNVTDNTSGAHATWAHKAGAAEYHYADAGMVVNNPLQHPPGPGSNFVLVGPFTGTTVTSYNGTRGTGINGRGATTKCRRTTARILSPPRRFSTTAGPRSTAAFTATPKIQPCRGSEPPRHGFPPAHRAQLSGPSSLPVIHPARTTFPVDPQPFRR